MSEWIDCEYAMPDKNKPVLVFYLSAMFLNPHQSVAIWFDGLRWRHLVGGLEFDNPPTHWMPLPEPPA